MSIHTPKHWSIALNASRDARVARLRLTACTLLSHLLGQLGITPKHCVDILDDCLSVLRPLIDNGTTDEDLEQILLETMVTCAHTVQNRRASRKRVVRMTARAVILAILAEFHRTFDVGFSVSTHDAQMYLSVGKARAMPSAQGWTTVGLVLPKSPIVSIQLPNRKRPCFEVSMRARA
jgi:hypothetical protein